MSLYLGFDTSNYTTSVSVFDSERLSHLEERMLLPVASGERGLRQSEAVFLHLKQLPMLYEKLMKKVEPSKIAGVSYSAFPRRAEGSYMPCFLVGEGFARVVSDTLKAPLKAFSHQEGHIAAALYSAERLELLENPFYALHLSGGTSEFLLVSPSECAVEVKVLGGSADISAGKLIDRVGVMLGLSFPAGKEIERLSLNGKPSKVNASVNNGMMNLSGFENQAKALYEKGAAMEDVAVFIMDAVKESVSKMILECVKDKSLPVVYSGGVMANLALRKHFEGFGESYFASPELSSDNATGIAALGSIF